MSVDALPEPTTARHRRDEDVPLPLKQYERLLVLLHRHRPGRRSGLCLECGQEWPCREVQLAAGSGRWW
jgi:hypothetical protein